MTTTFQIYPSLATISEPFEAVLLDAYGVFWGGNTIGPFPGAKESMEKLMSNGKIVGILSNSTQLSAKEIDKVKQHGILQGKHFHFFLTSGEFTRSLLLQDSLPFPTPHKKFWVYFNDHPRFLSHSALFQNTKYEETSSIYEADFIYVGVPHLKGEDQTDPQVFKDQVKQLVDTKLPMLCANPDRFAHEGNPGKLVARQGSIGRLYEEMGGTVFYIGKPMEQIYTFAMQYINQYKIVSSQQVLMVGDTPETDIRGARHVGMQAALTTQTGVMADRIEQQGLDQVVQSWTLGDYPNFFIERLADDTLYATS